jgi:chemotaxis protein MotB
MSVGLSGAVAVALVAVCMTVTSGCGMATKAEVEQGGQQLEDLRRQAVDLRRELHAAEQQAKVLAGKADAAQGALNEALASLHSSGVNVTPRGAAVVVTMASRVLFGAGQTGLQPDARQELVRIAGLLKDRFPDRTIVVEGHTDSSPPRRTSEDFPTNWEVSAARALAVLRCLVEDGGLPGQRMSAVAYGDTRPINGNKTDEQRAENRRVEIVVFPPIQTTHVSASMQ